MKTAQLDFANDVTGRADDGTGSAIENSATLVQPGWFNDLGVLPFWPVRVHVPSHAGVVQIAGSITAQNTPTIAAATITATQVLVAAINPTTVSLPTTPTQTQLQDVYFSSGINAGGTVIAPSFATWQGDNPATYAGSGSEVAEGKFANNAAGTPSSATAGTGGGVQFFYFDPSSNWTPAEQKQLADGLALWSSVTNISFVETTNPANAAITFVRSAPGAGSFASYTNITDSIVGSTTIGVRGTTSVNIDTSVYASSTLGSFSVAGGYALEDVLHEIGHVLGLGHPDPYNDVAGAGNPGGYVLSGPNANQLNPYDSLLWSTMSYVQPYDTAANEFNNYPTQVQDTDWTAVTISSGVTEYSSVYNTTMMSDDILAVQQLYGAPTGGPLSGGQVFGYDSNIGGTETPPPNGVASTTAASTVTTLGPNSTTSTGGPFNLTTLTTDATVDITGATTISFSTVGDVTTETSFTAGGTIISGTTISATPQYTLTHNNVPTIEPAHTFDIGGTTVDTPATTITTTTTPISITPEGIINSATTITTVGGQVVSQTTGTTVSGDIGQYYNFDINTNPVVTLFDTGTDNTLDLSKTATATFINLNPGNFSSFDNLTNNIGIAYGTEIDTADGGTGSNTYVVNSDSDTINGQGTNNTVVFDEPSTAVHIVHVSGSNYTVTQGSTVDRLNDVQTVVFTNETLDLATIACFVSGTRILTEHGEVPVERLAIGDRLMTRAGEARALHWIGTRSFEGMFLRANPAVLPIMIRAGALGEGIPRRDLVVSPQHALYLDQVLVPAQALVNGTTIVKLADLARVDYLHLELCTHDVIFAEGAAVETYLEDGNRGMFQNAGDYAAIYPQPAFRGVGYYAERHETGETVAALRARLAARAEQLGYRATRAYDVTLDQVGAIRATIPAGVTEVHLHSTAGAVPGDRRKLGALIHRIRIDGGPIDLADLRLVQGFYGIERHGAATLRWTNGLARIAIEPAPTDRAIEIEVATLVDLPLAC